MSIVIASVLIVSSIAVLYSMYRNLSEEAREWVATFSKMSLTLTLFVVIVASANYLITCGIK
jgi:hypothetical protein